MEKNDIIKKKNKGGWEKPNKKMGMEKSIF